MTNYLTLDQVLEARQIALRLSGSQFGGPMDLGMVRSILDHVQNDQYYPSFEEKITHLFFGLTKFHCFVDGNKRTALAATLYKLLINGHQQCALSFLRNSENLVVDVAANLVEKPLLLKIVRAKIAGTFDEDEVLKVEIYQAVFRPDIANA